MVFDKIIYRNAFSHIVGLLLVTSTFVVDGSNLPKGWDLPKVWFWQLSIIALLFTSIVFEVILFTRKRRIATSNTLGIFLSFSFFLLTSLIILLPTVLSKYYVTFLESDYRSPLYQFIGAQSVKLHLVGNQFRDQGAITYLLLIILSFLVYHYAKQNNFYTMLKYFAVTGFVQSLIGIYQQSAKIIGLGDYYSSEIYGTFGQSNFYTGVILLAVASTAFLTKSKKLNTKLGVFIIFLNILSIFMTSSTWVKMLLVILPVIYLFYNRYHIGIRKLMTFLLATLIVLIPLNSYILSNYSTGFEQRGLIWREVIGLNLSSNKFLNMLLGNGFDSLGFELMREGAFSDLYIDRSHNIFLDIYISLGILGLMFFLALVIFLISSAKKRSNEFSFVVVLIIVWLARSSVHTSSITNLVMFFILMGYAFRLRDLNKTKLD